MPHFLSDYEQGIKDERERMVALLRNKKALRDAIFDGELVLYTEAGPIDLSHKELEGTNV